MFAKINELDIVRVLNLKIQCDNCSFLKEIEFEICSDEDHKILKYTNDFITEVNKNEEFFLDENDKYSVYCANCKTEKQKIIEKEEKLKEEKLKEKLLQAQKQQDVFSIITSIYS